MMGCLNARLKIIMDECWGRDVSGAGVRIAVMDGIATVALVSVAGRIGMLGSRALLGVCSVGGGLVVDGRRLAGMKLVLMMRAQLIVVVVMMRMPRQRHFGFQFSPVLLGDKFLAASARAKHQRWLAVVQLVFAKHANPVIGCEERREWSRGVMVAAAAVFVRCTACDRCFNLASRSRGRLA